MNLKAVRESRRYTQASTARALNIDRSLLNKIENGVCLPTPKLAQRLCELYNCKMSDIISKEDFHFVNKKRKCAQCQNDVCTPKKTKSRVNTYNYHVRLNREDFPLLQKNELKRLGFSSNGDFFAWAYEKLKKRARQKQGSQTKIN